MKHLVAVGCVFKWTHSVCGTREQSWLWKTVKSCLGYLTLFIIKSFSMDILFESPNCRLRAKWFTNTV